MADLRHLQKPGNGTVTVAGGSDAMGVPSGWTRPILTADPVKGETVTSKPPRLPWWVWALGGYFVMRKVVR